jgi:hypothetical protein
VGVGVVGLTSCKKAIEDLQDHVTVMQLEMRAFKLDAPGGKFVPRAAPPTKRLGNAIAYEGAIYMLGGYDPSLHASGVTEKYDPATDTWSTRAAWPNPRATSEFFELSSQLCTLGALVHPGDQGLSCYDPAKDAWSERASIPTDGSAAYRSVVANGKLYAFASSAAKQTGDAGAFDATTYDEAGTDVGPEPAGALNPSDFYVYDPATDKWAQKTSAPFQCNYYMGSGSGQGHYGMVSIGTSLYVIGCVENAGGTTIGASLVYDTVADTWSQIPDPDAGNTRGQDINAFVFGGKIVIVGQRGIVKVFDPSTRTWSVPKSTPPPILFGTDTAVADSTGFFFFEMTDLYTVADVRYLGSVWRYDVAPDTWTKVTTLTRDVDSTYNPAFTAVMNGNDPYLVGSWAAGALTIH